MGDPVSDLLGIVREEINLYRNLIEHAQKKTALLVQGSVDAIQESNRMDESFNAKLRALEVEMGRVCRELSQGFRIPREEFTLMKLADNLEPSIAFEIRSQTTLFREIVKQLKSISRRNRKLIEKSVRCSRGLLSLISNASGSYRQNGLFEQIPSIQPSFSKRA